MITTLINHGADINWTLKSYSCHHQISESCFQKILKKLSAFPSSDYPSISLLSLLLSHGANPNEYSSSTSNGMRFTEWIYPIHSLTKQNDVACVKLLLEANAKISINSYHEIEEDTYFRTRETPLHIALFHQNLEMMKLLIEWKADINIKRYDTETKKRGDEDSSLRYTQKTCLHLAIERKNPVLMKYLLLNGANSYIKSTEFTPGKGFGKKEMTCWELCGENEELKKILEIEFRGNDYEFLSRDLKMMVKILLLANLRNNWKLPKEILFKIFSYVIRST